jgi:hypothetical protein
MSYEEEGRRIHACLHSITRTLAYLLLRVA